MYPFSSEIVKIIEAVRRDFNPYSKYLSSHDSPLDSTEWDTGISQIVKLIRFADRKGASYSEMTRLIKYYLVFLESRYHALNYHEAFEDYEIPMLYWKYGLKDGFEKICCEGTVSVRVRGDDRNSVRKVLQRMLKEIEATEGAELDEKIKNGEVRG